MVVGSCIPTLLVYESSAGATTPRLVVTRTTPLAALDPSWEAAAPSFSMDMFSTSCAASPSKANLSLTTPSMTYKGLELLKVPTARMRMLDSRPGVPAFCVIVAPANRPASALERLSAGMSAKSALLTEATDAVTVLRSCTR